MKSTQTEEILSQAKLLTVLAILLALTALTVGASYHNLGRWNIVIALGIASTKASLVLLYFMQMKSAGFAVRLSFLLTVGLLALFIGFLFWDISLR